LVYLYSTIKMMHGPINLRMSGLLFGWFDHGTGSSVSRTVAYIHNMALVTPLTVHF
jgi:hypothetical protein